MTRIFDRDFQLGVAFILLLAVVIAGAVAQYRGVFRSTITVEIEADRAGLTLDQAAPVKFRGVEIGDVDSLEANDGGVTVRLRLDKDRIDRVPANVTAQLVPPTAFGARYVQLTESTVTGLGGRIQDGQVITADHVTVEIDEAFTNLTEVLDAARPAQVNNALTAVAGAVNTRGEKIGQLVTRSEDYLELLNPQLDALAADLRRSDDVAAGYEKALPDLLTTLSNATRTSDTFVAQQKNLRSVLDNLTTFSDESRTLIRKSRAQLTSANSLLAPVSGVLQKYSSGLPCLVLGLQSANELAEKAVGGTNPGITTITRVAPSTEPYSYPNNLPLIGDRRGPACYGLPYVDPNEALAPSPTFVTGANPHAGSQAPEPAEDLLSTLFGSLKGLVNLP